MNWLEHTSATPDEALRVNMSTLDQLLADLDGRMTRREGFSVATLNMDHVVKLRSQPAFRAAYLRQSHVTADGNPIVWLSALSGQKISLVPGSDLLSPVIELAVTRGVPVALYGSSDASLTRTADALKIKYPSIILSNCIAPEMGFDPEGEGALADIETLKNSGTGLCLLALGAPKQEIFAARAQEIASGIGFLSIGAGLDFISGHQRRAPRLVRALALEWLWRLVLSPGRLAARYARCFLILPELIYIALKTRYRSGTQTS